MIGRTNAGASKSIALIRVQYKPNTVCTCKNSSETIVYHSDESGDYLFGIPSAGTWTVTGQDSGGTTRTVQVTVAKGDGKLVTLNEVLPTGYQQVEYLALTAASNANIPLGVTPTYNSAWDIEMNVSLDAIVDTQRIVSAGGTSGDYTGGGWYVYIFGNLAMYYGSGAVASASTSTNTFHDLKVHTASDGAKLYVDDTAVCTFSTAVGLGTDPYKIGADFLGSAGMKCKRVKISSGGTVGHDFLPCKRTSDNMPGYYDIETNTFLQGKNGSSTTVSDVTSVITCGPNV